MGKKECKKMEQWLDDVETLFKDMDKVFEGIDDCKTLKEMHEDSISTVHNMWERMEIGLSLMSFLTIVKLEMMKEESD